MIQATGANRFEQIELSFEISRKIRNKSFYQTACAFLNPASFKRLGILTLNYAMS